MNVVILTAGEATRLGDLAPYGCKALVQVGDQTALDWQLLALPDDTEHVTVVCRTTHAHHLSGDYEIVIDDSLTGPTGALSTVHLCAPTLVLFSDTLYERVPEYRGESWVGVNIAKGGRIWDVRERVITNRYQVPARKYACVCVGMYYFADHERLYAILHSPHAAKWHMMLNNYRIDRDELVEGWLDIGDPDALAAAQEQLTDVL